jgi:hypothetical protein
LGRYHHAKRDPNCQPDRPPNLRPANVPDKKHPKHPPPFTSEPNVSNKKKAYTQYSKQLIENHPHRPTGSDFIPPAYRIRLGKEVK